MTISVLKRDSSHIDYCDGTEWTQVADTGPSPRMGHKVVYDSGINKILLFGGLDGTTV